MARSVMRPVLPLLAVLLTACASHRDNVVAFMDTQLEYPSPDSQRCDAEQPGLTQLRVRVADSEGAAIEGVDAYVASVTHAGTGTAVPDVESTRTDRSGSAAFEALGAGSHVVTVAVLGFLPQARGVRLGAGCTGEILFTLRLAPEAR